MITTDQLIERLDNIDEAHQHHADLAARGVTPVTNASYALAYAAKAELLRSLIALSQREDERRGGRPVSAYSAAYDRGLAFGEAHPGRIDTEINTALDNRDLAVSHDDLTGYVAGLAAAKVRRGEDG